MPRQIFTRIAINNVYKANFLNEHDLTLHCMKFRRVFSASERKLGLAHICKVEEEKMNEWKL